MKNIYIHIYIKEKNHSLLSQLNRVYAYAERKRERECVSARYIQMVHIIYIPIILLRLLLQLSLLYIHIYYIYKQKLYRIYFSAS